MSANDNAPFDEKEWKKKYQREYMRKKRERERAAFKADPKPPKPTEESR